MEIIMHKLLTIGLAAITLASAAAPVLAAPPLGDKDHDGIPNAIDNHDDRWDPAWGAVVPAPRRWDRHRGWNHHVSMCREKYPTYDARRDMYKMHRRWMRCSL
jgi:hypothetical protein